MKWINYELVRPEEQPERFVLIYYRKGSVDMISSVAAANCGIALVSHWSEVEAPEGCVLKPIGSDPDPLNAYERWFENSEDGDEMLMKASAFGELAWNAGVKHAEENNVNELVLRIVRELAEEIKKRKE